MIRTAHLLALALLPAAAGCFGPGSRELPDVACWTEDGAPADTTGWLGDPSRAPGASGSLELLLRLDAAAPRGRVLIRVDPGDDADSPVREQPTPAAGVGLALEPPGIFRGCGSARPARLHLQSAGEGLDKVWVRAWSPGPVHVRVQAGGGSGEAVVQPGTSATVAWGAAGG